MKKILVFSIFFLFSFGVSAQYSGALPGYKIVTGNNWVKAKNYYLLTLLEQDKQVQSLLKADAQLSKLSQEKYNALQAAIKNCKDGLCLPAALKFTDADIELVSSLLAALYKPGNALDKLVKTQLIPSGCYILYKDETPANLLIKAWQQDAAAVNFAIGVYGEGRKPNYPAIDSISFDVHKKNYLILMYDCATEVADVTRSTSLFFAIPLHSALTYLEINERNNAGDFEPMAATENKLAVTKIKTINWAGYPYSHILVPGAGPDNLITPLSGEGMLRCRTAARAYFTGKAPFVVVSGGAVHPYKTRNNEAIEMRKYMIKTLHVPAYAVIIDPHARHTTTNIRNDVRIVFRYSMPFAQPGLIVTDKYQNDFIENMEKRCLNELKYIPYKLGKRLSETELEFYPVITSLQIDADEPMDP
ncbi:YdcF family protein [Mucilaginibacter sp. 14171R-50]|uniref:YdcF family protein n=1 Tax=Mucilaginibacter sp. 14171R-50 TaxID=2703789 RepID=UPI00138C6B83|nr:YdcF family protein [Mucilaginibacter sp. 14171R-50]QHS56424.1 YdcF family protein [Mucilaginibacter sp. 14171R-50]